MRVVTYVILLLHLDLASVFTRRVKTRVLLWQHIKLLPAVMGPDGPEWKTCTKCKKSWPCDASNFKTTRDGFTKSCLPCLKRSAEVTAEKKHASSDKENSPPTAEVQNDDNLSDLSTVDLDTFLHSLQGLSDSEDVISLDAHVDLSSLMTMDSSSRMISDSFAKKIWEQLKYRFV
jgi:hypothetical protein